MDQEASINTYQALISAFTELLIVSIHTILAERDVYPKSSFLKARKWGLAVYQSRHPGVIKWIDDAVESVETEILKGTVRQASLVILSPAGAPLERFVFSTASFPALPAADVQATFSTSNAESATEATPEEPAGYQIPGVSMIDLAVQFRGLLSRICSFGSRLEPLPPGCSFTVAVELRDKPEGEAPVGWPQPFIPSSRKVGAASTSSRVTPVRSIDVGFFEMETWIEETRDKLEIVASRTTSFQTTVRSPTPEDDRIVDPLLEAMEGKTFMR